MTSVVFLSLRRVIGCSYAFAIANVAYVFARYSNGTIECNGRSWISGMDSRFFDHPAKRVFSTSSFSTSLLHATVARFFILDLLCATNLCRLRPISARWILPQGSNDRKSLVRRKILRRWRMVLRVRSSEYSFAKI